MILAHLQKLSWKHALDIELAQAERNIDKKVMKEFARELILHNKIMLIKNRKYVYETYHMNMYF